ncbi:MAG TPA: pitrilysin family protein [Gemmataceae bacterium]
MQADVHQQTFPNGLTLLAESMPHVRSAAFNFLVPAGCAYDPPGQEGLATVLTDLITRGAGERDSRELALALDNLGLDRDESVGSLNMRFYGATLSRNLPAALALYADILRRPHLPEEDLEPAQMLALQDLHGLEDSPGQKVMVELRRHYYPHPLSKDRFGTAEGIRNVTIDAVRRQFQRRFGPKGTILAVAGNVEWGPLCDLVGRLFGDWSGAPEVLNSFGPNAVVRGHVHKDTEQTHIALSWPSVPFGHPDYYAARGAEGVLSGGMSARLFEEVREKHGLCYSIYAFHETFKDRGSMLCHTATVADRAPQTLKLTLRELKRLEEGIEEDEVERVRAGLKAALIMQGESTSARAGAIASDWYYLGRVRSLDEIQAAIDGLTPEGILEHVRRYPAKDFALVTLGPKELELPE